MKLEDYIEQHSFRQFIHEDHIVDTRPYVGRVTKPAKDQLAGLCFTGYGFKGIYNKGTPAEVEKISSLPVGHTVAGRGEPAAAGNWKEVLKALPPEVQIYVDEWTESGQYVGLVTFARDQQGQWVSLDQGHSS